VKEKPQTKIVFDRKNVILVFGVLFALIGALFFLRDLGVNLIGATSGWTIIIVLVGAGLLAGDFELNRIRNQKAAAAANKK